MSYNIWFYPPIAGDLHYQTDRDNRILEMALAGSWISAILWLIIFILMVVERHHIKAHLTDESMWGSEFGGMYLLYLISSGKISQIF